MTGWALEICSEADSAPRIYGAAESCAQSLADCRFGMQRYGSEPNQPLVEFLEGAGAAVRIVAPDVYTDQSDGAAVHSLRA